MRSRLRRRHPFRDACRLLLALGALALGPMPGLARAQDDEPTAVLDFRNVELREVIPAIARIARKRFVYDDQISGTVTIMSDEPVSVDEMMRMFESALLLKGYAIIEGGAGEVKIVRVHQAKQMPVPILGPDAEPPDRDVFVTKLFPLQHVKAESVKDTAAQLASADGRVIADAGSNMLIITDTGASIRHIMDVVSALDVTLFDQQIEVIPLEHADAAGTLLQLQEMFGAGRDRPFPEATRRGAEGSSAPSAPEVLLQRPPQFMADTRTNSIVVVAPSAALFDVNRIVALLDVKRSGTGHLNIYHVEHVDAEDLAKTLRELAQGGGAAPGAGAAWNGGGRALGADGGLSITADGPTNSLLIQATPGDYAALRQVLSEIDVQTAQVQIEVLMLETRVDDGKSFGTNLLYRGLMGGSDSAGLYGVGSVPTGALPPALADGTGVLPAAAASSAAPFSTTLVGNTVTLTDASGVKRTVPLTAAMIEAAEKDGRTDILSSPQILTADNTEARIVVGENRGFPISQLQAVGPVSSSPFQTSTQIERRDVGITLSLTPQITTGDSVRMRIFTELSNVTDATNPYGPTTNHREIENTVYVKNGESVMIGGIIQDQLDKGENRVPMLGSLPGVGWMFRSTSQRVIRTNLMMLLTPRIVRGPTDLQKLSIEGRERFRDASGLPKDEDELRRKALEDGLDGPPEADPVRRDPEPEVIPLPAPSWPRPQISEEKPQVQRLQPQSTPAPLPVTQPAPEQLAPQGPAADRSTAPEPPLGPVFMLVLDPIRDEAKAVALVDALTTRGYHASRQIEKRDGRTVHIVRVGPYPGPTSAKRGARHILRDLKQRTRMVTAPAP
jgi:general secretion pathway protein D